MIECHAVQEAIYTNAENIVCKCLIIWSILPRDSAAKLENNDSELRISSQWGRKVDPPHPPVNPPTFDGFVEISWITAERVFVNNRYHKNLNSFLINFMLQVHLYKLVSLKLGKF